MRDEKSVIIILHIAYLSDLSESGTLLCHKGNDKSYYFIILLYFVEHNCIANGSYCIIIFLTILIALTGTNILLHGYSWPL